MSKKDFLDKAARCQTEAILRRNSATTVFNEKFDRVSQK